MCVLGINKMTPVRSFRTNMPDIQAQAPRFRKQGDRPDFVSFETLRSGMAGPNQLKGTIQKYQVGKVLTQFVYSFFLQRETVVWSTRIERIPYFSLLGGLQTHTHNTNDNRDAPFCTCCGTALCIVPDQMDHCSPSIHFGQYCGPWTSACFHYHRTTLF